MNEHSPDCRVHSEGDRVDPGEEELEESVCDQSGGKSNLQTPKHLVSHSHLFKLHLVFLTAALQFLSLRSQAAVIFGVFSLFQWQRYFAIDVFTEFHNYVASKCQLAQLKNVSKREKKIEKKRKTRFGPKITLFFNSFLGFFWPICSNVICINHYSLVLFGFFCSQIWPNTGKNYRAQNDTGSLIFSLVITVNSYISPGEARCFFIDKWNGFNN